ncbi:DUF3558 domain-containing protein [Saccharomonospora piscinae]|nr:DUF3558 domain-containing protein [Saccharomonospora piscinae]
MLPTAAMVVLASSCSATTSGTPKPEHSSNSTSATTGQPDGRYFVENPLDVTSFLGRPCDLVSPGVLAELGFLPEGGRARTSESDAIAKKEGPYCGWSGSDEGNLTVAIQSGNADRGVGGLDGLFDLHSQGRFEYWSETTVDGYPAAYHNMLETDREEGNCSLGVGIQKELSFSVSADYYTDNPEQACQVAEAIAADVVENLKGAS